MFRGSATLQPQESSKTNRPARRGHNGPRRNI
jgi:hypothetical protein